MISKKNGAIITLLALSPYVLSMGGQVFFANYLSVNEVGIFALIQVFIGMILAFTNWNCDKFLISKRNITNNQIDEIFTFEFLYGLFLYIVTIIFLKDYVNAYLDIDNSNTFWIALALIYLYWPLSRTRAILEKRLSYSKAYSPAFIANVLAIVIGIFCLFQGLGFWSMVIWKISIHAFEVILLLCVATYVPKFRLDFSQLSTMLRFSLPIYSGSVISFIGNNLDKLVISALLGARELGLYWLSFSLSHIPVIFREVIARFILPILSLQKSNSEKVKIFDKLNGILQLLSVISAIFILYWSDILIDFVLGEKWSEITPIFTILYFAALFKFVGGSCASLLFSGMKTRVAFDIAWMNLIFLSPMMFVAIKFGGLTGAALAVFAITLVINIFVYETDVRKFCNSGYLYYLGYLTINIGVMLLVLILFEDSFTRIDFKLLGTLASLGIAFISLPINKTLKRPFSIKAIARNT